MTSQAENGPCPFLPCSISFSSCLSFVMDTACNKKSQHIYGVADPASTRLLYRPATKQLCYPLRIPESSSGGRRLRAASLTLACEQKERIAFFSPVFSFFRMKFHLDLEADKSRCGEILFCSDRPLSNVYERLVKLRLSTARNLRGATKRHSDSSGEGKPRLVKEWTLGAKREKGMLNETKERRTLAGLVYVFKR